MTEEDELVELWRIICFQELTPEFRAVANARMGKATILLNNDERLSIILTLLGELRDHIDQYPPNEEIRATAIWAYLHREMERTGAAPLFTREEFEKRIQRSLRNEAERGETHLEG